MAATPAPACRAALLEATSRWPARNRAGDGIMSSDAHKLQNPGSDHDFGNAWDLTHDPDNGVNTYILADQLRQALDPRVKYIISNRHIWNPSIKDAWRPYAGPDPHTGHMHVSILATARDDTSEWFGFLDPPTPVEEEMVFTTQVLANRDGKVVEFFGHTVMYDTLKGAWPMASTGTWSLVKGLDGSAIAYADPPAMIAVHYGG